MKPAQKKIVAAVAGLAAVLAIGGGVALGTGMADDSDTPISGSALQQATEAALEYTGGGRVTATEVGDEESLYEVEVTLDDGRQVDVQLDENFNVVGSEAETGPDDEAGEDEGQD